jgi:hypothetical protein
MSHRQGVKWRDCTFVRDVRNVTPMSESFDIKRMRQQLQGLMERKSVKRKPLAKAAGLGETSIRDPLYGDGHISRI